MITESNNFRMTLGSYLAYIYHYRFAKTLGTRILIVGFFVFMVVFGIYLFVRGKDHDVISLVSSLIPPLICYVVWLAVCQYILPVWGFAAAKRRGSYRHECKVYMDESEVWTNSEDGELRKPWKSIESVSETAKHIFIYFNKCNAFVVPKAAFTTRNDASFFCLNAKKYLQDSKPSVLS